MEGYGSLEFKAGFNKTVSPDESHSRLFVDFKNIYSMDLSRELRLESGITPSTKTVLSFILYNS